MESWGNLLGSVCRIILTKFRLLKKLLLHGSSDMICLVYYLIVVYLLFRSTQLLAGTSCAFIQLSYSRAGFSKAQKRQQTGKN